MNTIVTRHSLQAMIDNADANKLQHIIGRALVALFMRQTQDEQADNTTKQLNGVGFAHCDSVVGSLTAKSYLKNKQLTDWQVAKWTKQQKNGYARLCKYAKQLNEIAVAKQGDK